MEKSLFPLHRQNFAVQDTKDQDSETKVTNHLVELK